MCNLTPSMQALSDYWSARRRAGLFRGPSFKRDCWRATAIRVAGLLIFEVVMPLAPPRHRPPGMPTREEAERRRKALLDQRRPPPDARGYDADWRRCRRLFLEKHPTCAMCGVKATEVDHIVSVRERPDLRLKWSNLRALDRGCHSRRTALDQGFARSSPR